MISVETFADPVAYNRRLEIQDSVKNCLRNLAKIEDKNNRIDWNTEEFKTELISQSNRKCEDRLKVILIVNFK